MGEQAFTLIIINCAFHVIPLLFHYFSPKSAAANISCVVSLGCGEYPPEPLGNVDVTSAFNITKFHLIHQCVRSLLVLLKHAVCSTPHFTYFRIDS